MIKPYLKNCFVYVTSEFIEISKFNFIKDLEKLNIEFYIEDKLTKKGSEKFSFSVYSECYVVECIVNNKSEISNRKGIKILPKISKELILEYITNSIKNANSDTWNSLVLSLAENFYTDYD